MLHRLFGQPAAGAVARGASPSVGPPAVDAATRAGGWAWPAAGGRPPSPGAAAGVPVPIAHRITVEGDSSMLMIMADDGEELVVDDQSDGSVTISAVPTDNGEEP